MDVNELLATIVLVSFVATVVLAVGSYIAYKARERRRPRRADVGGPDPVFFERFFPPVGMPADGGAGGGSHEPAA